MLTLQKKLLADIRAVETSAAALLKGGVKVAGIVQKLRAAGAEAEARVRFLEKNSAPVAPKAARQAEPKPKANGEPKA